MRRCCHAPSSAALSALSFTELRWSFSCDVCTQSKQLLRPSQDGTFVVTRWKTLSLCLCSSFTVFVDLRQSSRSRPHSQTGDRSQTLPLLLAFASNGQSVPGHLYQTVTSILQTVLSSRTFAWIQGSRRGFYMSSQGWAMGVGGWVSKGKEMQNLRRD